MRAVFYLAVVCLAVSAVTHVSTFFGVNPQRMFAAIGVLHILVLVVWLPVVLSCRRACRGNDAKDFWRIATRNAPHWMKALSVMLFACAFVNFFLTVFVLGECGQPDDSDFKKVLRSHDRIIRELTDEEFELHQTYGTRESSGNWMVFYGIGMTVLYSRLRDTPDDPPEPTS
ncbi:MAG: hypothetical protein JXO22_03450 [Phycisphaerae bacterium]|nr:hypothetical protein [Phycisphaerae bacterium]